MAGRAQKKRPGGPGREGAEETELAAQVGGREELLLDIPDTTNGRRFLTIACFLCFL